MNNDRFNNIKQYKLLDDIKFNHSITYNYILGCNKVYYIYAIYGLLHLLHDEYQYHTSCELTSDEFKKQYDKLRKSNYANIILEKNKNAVCSYCLHSVATEIDHYLVKSKYPSYAIVYNNLVPSCHKCNHKKHTKIPKNKIWFIHPNFEEIPPDFFLKVDFNDNYNKLVFCMPWDNSSTYFILMKRIEYTFNELSIFKEYSRLAHQELSLMIREYLNPNNQNKSLQKFLQMKFEVSCEEPNMLWKKSLYKFLKDDWYFIKTGYKIYAENFGISVPKVLTQY